MALETGARLGPYEIISILGAGGMGEVYKARDTRLDRMVAVKIIRGAFGADEERRFEQEARLVAQLNHPSVLILHDFGLHEGAPYMVSEFIEGESLRALVTRGPIPARRAIDIARDVAQGLAAAHDRGIIHRDLKPENILITRSGRAKILDFGIAKVPRKGPWSGEFHDAPTAHLPTEPGHIMGTAGYVSPEQVRGGEADSRSDIFAFGAIVHEMLSGKRLFVRGSSVESLNAILKDEPAELSEFGVVAPQILERAVRRCLEKEPAMRFQSAHDLAFALESMDTAPRMTDSAGLAFALPHSRRRFGTILGMAALTALAFVVGSWWPERGSQLSSFEFQRLTFQPGTAVGGVRFAPDGQTVVYDGRFGSNPGGVFTTRPGSYEFRSLDLPAGTQLLAVSSTGELAIRLADPQHGGVLAQVPLAGGVPRPLVEGVTFADWSPDGKELAIVRSDSGGSRLEYPIGTTLAEVKFPNRIIGIRVSPQGDRVAFLEKAPGQNSPGRVCVVDRGGSKSVLTGEWQGGLRTAWSRDGREVYFSGSKSESTPKAPGAPQNLTGPPSIRAVNMAGRERLLLKAFTELQLADASHGRLLLIQTVAPNIEMLIASANRPARDLSWLNWSTPADISPDGKLVLFDEQRTGGGTDLVYLRNTDGSPPVRLGTGVALALSADGGWAATVLTRARPSPIVLMPTGAGKSRTLRNDGLSYLSARFFQDGKRLLVRANEAGHNPRLYVVDLSTEMAQPLTPEGFNFHAPSADGTRVATVAPDGRIMSFAISGGEGVALPGFEPGDEPIQWSADDKSIFALHATNSATNRGYDVFRVTLASGKRELWRSHSPGTAQGSIFRVLITPDGKHSVVMSYPGWVELYVVDGVS